MKDAWVDMQYVADPFISLQVRSWQKRKKKLLNLSQVSRSAPGLLVPSMMTSEIFEARWRYTDAVDAAIPTMRSRPTAKALIRGR
jgi:formylmethanofuran dehydrogenase subunit A